MTKPLILVITDVKPLDGYDWHAAPSTYLQALISGSGAIPLMLPSFGTDIDLEAVLERVDGVLATGSRSNVNPQLYGEEPTEANGPYDADRDATSLPLLKLAVDKGVPVFAICRGMQELNVAFGGTLLTEIQEMQGRADHRAPTSGDQDERFRTVHPIDVKPGSQLGKAVGNQPIEVNSLHRQALGELGNGLEIEAQAADGTIEAVSVTGAKGFVLATQWHPEYWFASDGPSKKLFSAFGDAARLYAANK